MTLVFFYTIGCATAGAFVIFGVQDLFIHELNRAAIEFGAAVMLSNMTRLSALRIAHHLNKEDEKKEKAGL